MRIVGGEHRGRLFNPGKSFKARPTTDMAKESLFNILLNQIDFEAIKVLDLFSGTGSISFEFASRGCPDITSIELNFQHHRFITEVIQKLGVTSIKAVKANAFQYCSKTDQSFDLIFADPPYDHKQFAEVPDLVLSGDLLKPDGLFILEHPKNHNFSSRPEFVEVRNYGSVHFSFFRK
ncbi:RsmD family RNA methyltransferase [Mangrovibacterium lignilyticum]|uniref:RsmD family RNA methyltransferase n=1 Tax=Mangrovibacterium lignilyticum TaxID=2668052 RepID=UPI0013D87E62|nr:RsmD family RNA methyltransferase [Mangrovibacterium lignilyticum]